MKMDPQPIPLDYAPPPPPAKYPWVLRALVVANGLAWLSVLSLFRYPDGAAGYFVAPEICFAVPLGLGVALFGFVYSAILALKRHRFRLALLVFLLASSPLALFLVGYNLVDHYKGFNFGPG